MKSDNSQRPYISHTGSYLPDNIVSNDDLSKKVDTSDEWIQSRVGIKQRHVVAENEASSDMSTKVANSLLKIVVSEMLTCNRENFEYADIRTKNYMVDRSSNFPPNRIFVYEGLKYCATIVQQHRIRTIFQTQTKEPTSHDIP